MEAFEVCDFRLIACFDKSVETGADEFGCSSTENSLFAEEICLCLFFK